MARKNDPFAVERRAKKKEKPEKRQKDTFSAKGFGFESKDSVSFGGESKKEKPKKEPKAAKAQKESSFGFNSKEEKPERESKRAKGNKETKPRSEKRIRSKSTFGADKSTKFNGHDDSVKKSKTKIDFKSKKTRLILAFSIAAILVIAVLAAAAVGIVSDIQEQNNAPVGVSVGDFPKLSYYVGDDADYSGLSLAVTKRNGKIEYVKYSEDNAADFTFSGFDSTRTYEDKTVTVTYKGFSCTYHIVVKEAPKPKPTLVSITIDVMPKTEYKVGEWLDTTGGMLLKHYSDGTTERTVLVNNYIIDGWDEAWELGAGETGSATYTLTVRYKEDGSKPVKTTYDITITE